MSALPKDFWTAEEHAAAMNARADDSRVAELEAQLDRLAEGLHPRVLKLAGRDEPFIVIGCREPYFARAYGMIRKQEQKQGTWTEEDERCWLEAIRAHRKCRAVLAAGRALKRADAAEGR